MTSNNFQGDAMAEVKVLVYPSKDVESTKALFNTFFGVEPYADSPYYVGYRIGSMEVGIDPNGTEIIAYTEVEDAASSLQALVDAGASIVQEPKDVGGGMLIAQAKDASGNVIGLRQANQ
jgi:predicted enzyme related to lactoylglutathione lyase